MSDAEIVYLQMPRERIVDLIWTLEGHDGLAVVRVLDKLRGLVELLVAPDLRPELDRVLAELAEKYFPLAVIERPEGIASIADQTREEERA